MRRERCHTNTHLCSYLDTNESVNVLQYTVFAEAMPGEWAPLNKEFRLADGSPVNLEEDGVFEDPVTVRRMKGLTYAASPMRRRRVSPPEPRQRETVQAVCSQKPDVPFGRLKQRFQYPDWEMRCSPETRIINY